MKTALYVLFIYINGTLIVTPTPTEPNPQVSSDCKVVGKLHQTFDLFGGKAAKLQFRVSHNNEVNIDGPI